MRNSFIKMSLLVFIVSCSTSNMEINEANETNDDKNRVCHDGESKQGYITNVTSGNAPCAPGFQTCISGQWVGPFLYDTCTNFTKDCEGQPHGSIQGGYLQPTASGGMTCIPSSRTCINGNWTGPEVFSSCTQIP
jgi:hypothetical protein